MPNDPHHLYEYGVSIRILEREIWAGDDNEPSRFVHEWRGNIELSPPECGEATVIGSVGFQYLDLSSALNEGVPFFDVFDTTAALMDAYEALFDSTSDELRRDVLRLATGQDFHLDFGLLLLARLEVLPEHRGHLVGLRVMKAIIEAFRHGAGLAALKVFPLQFEGDIFFRPDESAIPRSALRLDELSRVERVARAKLKRYYGRLGFIALPRSEYMVRDALKALPQVIAVERARRSRS